MSASETGLVSTLTDLAGAFKPWSVRRLEAEIDRCVAQVPTALNEYGYDPYGLHPDVIRRMMIPAALLYRHYFRAETHGIENVPAGRVMLVANHAGQLPFDGMMLATAMLLEGKPPRVARPMAEYWVSELPFIGVAAARGGSLVGTPRNCVSMLGNDECVMVFPEGVRGMNKTFFQRYKLQRFGTGFLRIALESRSPIVPVAIVGSEEQQPGLANLKGVGKLFGMPALPITLGFPWLGPLGLLPMPVKYHIYFGKPIQFEGSAEDEDAIIMEKVERVKSSITHLADRGRSRRRGIFR